VSVADAGEQPDNDLRELEFKKNQYGPRGESLILRYQRGLFLPEGGLSNLDQATRRAKAEDVFMELLHRFAGKTRNVSDKATANNYAPTVFAKEDEARKHRLKKAEFEQAMRDLFKANRITLEQYEKPSLHRYRLAAC
jgi:RecA-family ATPase